jgi:hypothetical protein
MTKHFGKPEYMRDKEVLKALSPMPAQCIAIMIAAVSALVAHPILLTICEDSICFGSFC